MSALLNQVRDVMRTIEMTGCALAILSVEWVRYAVRCCERNIYVKCWRPVALISRIGLALLNY